VNQPHEELEHVWQEAAERGRSEAAEGVEVELYRRVYAAVREAELPEIPFGFARRLEQAVFVDEKPDRADAVEDWVGRLGLCLLLILMLATAAPVLLPWLARWDAAAPAPWWPAAASGVALLGWKLLDRPATAGRPSGGEAGR
jgi:hypothetical protein